MIKGYAQRRIDRLAWEIAIYDKQRKIAFTLDFKAHGDQKQDCIIPTTFIDDHGGEQNELMQAFADALNQMGFIPDNATSAELKATKYHLEDMRKLALK